MYVAIHTYSMYVCACTYIQLWFICSPPFPLPLPLLPSPPPFPLPAVPTEPNYYSTTHSFSQHARVSPSKAPNISTRGKDTTATKEKVCTYVRMYICMHTHMELVEVVYTCMCVTVLNPLCCTNTQVQFITYVHVHTYVCTVGTVRVLLI